MGSGRAERALDRAHGLRELRQRARALPNRSLAVGDDAERLRLAGLDREARDRQRVEHLVGDDDAAERRFGKPLEPLHAARERRERALLPLA